MLAQDGSTVLVWELLATCVVFSLTRCGLPSTVILHENTLVRVVMLTMIMW